MISFPKVAAVLGAIALLIPAPARAESWVQLDDRMTIDADSVLMNGDLRMYWLRFDYGSQFFMSHATVNCVTGRDETMEIVVYNASGRATDSKRFRPGENSRYIIPGSNGSLVLNFVCH